MPENSSPQPAPLQVGEAGFRAFVEFAPDGVVIVDHAGVITLVNSQLERMFGFGRAELLGRPIEVLVPEALREGHVAQRDGFLAAPRLRPMGAGRELMGRRKDGSEFPVEISLGPLQMAGGLLVTAIVRDVTERRRAEQTVRKLSAAVEQAADSIFITDVNGVIEFVNPAFERMTGYSSAEAVGRTPRILRSGRHDRKFYQGLWETLLGGGVFRGVVQNRRKDGVLYYEDKTIVPLKDANGGITHLVSTGRDITDRKRIEEEAAKHARDLARSNAELEQFAYVASHDLQEPLRMVASYTQLLARRYKGKLDGDADEFIGFAVDGVNRMRDLINDLLTYSRVGTQGRPFEPVDSAEVLDKALANLQAAVQETNAAVTHDPLPRVSADGRQLVQLFQNLIGNAVKFRGKDAPRVHVSAELGEDAWHFCVKDNGIGIDPQYADRIFMIFERLHTRSEYPGTGIGLAICKKIVERHGGRIWLESEAGKGAAFHFTIPVRETNHDGPERG